MHCSACALCTANIEPAQVQVIEYYKQAADYYVSAEKGTIGEWKRACPCQSRPTDCEQIHPSAALATCPALAPVKTFRLLAWSSFMRSGRCPRPRCTCCGGV